MPRTARATEAGMIYHVLNRGNGRMRLFHKAEDYRGVRACAWRRAPERYPVELLTYCVMPNHWHLVVRPRTDEALGRWMGWVGVTHVRRTTNTTIAAAAATSIRDDSRAFRCRGRLLSYALPLRRGQPAARRAGRSG